MSDLFISHDHDDREAAQKLRDALAERGFDVWWDRDIGTGERWRDTLTEALDRSKQVIVIWSRRSVKSEWVIAEATRARQQKKLIPVSIDDADIPMPFGEYQTLAIEEWLGQGAEIPFQVLSRRIRKQLRRLRRQVVVAVVATALLIFGAWGAYTWMTRKSPLELSQEQLRPLKSETGHDVFLLPFRDEGDDAGLLVTEEKIDRAINTFVQTLGVAPRGLQARVLDEDLSAWEKEYWDLGGFLNALGVVRGEQQQAEGEVALVSDFFIIPRVEGTPDRLVHTERYTPEEIGTLEAYKEREMQQSWGYRTAFALAVLQVQRGVQGDDRELESARELLSGLLPHTASDEMRAQQIRTLLDYIDEKPWLDGGPN